MDAQASEAMLHIKVRALVAVQRRAFLTTALSQAVCFLRPTGENIAVLRRHLHKPKFGEYHVCACLTVPCGSLPAAED